jgi:hypothetical protein
VFLPAIRLALAILLLRDRASLPNVGWCTMSIDCCDVHEVEIMKVEVKLSHQPQIKVW